MNPFRLENLTWRSIPSYLSNDVIDLTRSSGPSEDGSVDGSPSRKAPPQTSNPRPGSSRPSIVATTKSESPFSTSAPTLSATVPDGPARTLEGADKRTNDPTPTRQDVSPRPNGATPTGQSMGKRTNESTPAKQHSDRSMDRSPLSRHSASRGSDSVVGDRGRTASSTPLKRRRDSGLSSKTTSPTAVMSSVDKTNSSNKLGASSPPRDSASRRAAPAAHGSGVQMTPRQQQTPKKLDWTVDKIAGKLREFANDLEEQHNIMIYRTVGKNSRTVKERRVFEGEDLFANVKMPPMPEDKSLTVRMKFKQHSSNTRRTNNSSLGRRTETLPVIPLKTNVDRAPPYRFHHIEIKKNILTPQTRLDYIPHIKDVDESEETRYNRWLQELEEMEAASGFETLSREQRAAKTRSNECTARLAVVLPAWLKALSIDGCTKNTLIRYMATQAQTNTITPQQKTSILDSCGRDDMAGSPRSATAAKLFTEAFDQVFYAEKADFAAVTLRDVLFRDEFVDNIIDPKRSTMKDVTATPKPAEVFSLDKPLLEQTYLETYFVFGCLICFSNSCEHGEYDAKNQKRTFSMEVWGGVDGALKRRAMRAADDNALPENRELYAQPCSDLCYRAVGDAFSGPEEPWDPSEIRSLRILVETSPTGPSHRPPECNVAGFLGRPCWAVRRKVREIGITPRMMRPPTTSQGPVKNLPWYDRWKKMLLGDWQDHVKIHDHARRDIVEPCAHDGPCTAEIGCPCVKAGVLCERFCRCTAKTCPYKFTGCACHSLGKLCHAKQKERPCVCVQLNRECDPALCRGCGAADRADPENRDDDELHETGCQNCALQRGKSKQVVLARSLLDGCGYGLVTAEDIAQDEFVIEYVGELIVQDEGVRREARRGDDVFCDQKAPSYVFSLLEDEGTWVDGAVYGNLSRYINHAPEGNLTPKVLYVNHEYRIRFTALRDIKAGEELFFNYGDNFPNLTQKLLEDRVEQGETGQGTTRKRGRRPGPRRGRGQGRGRARVQGGRKTAPPETTTEWDFVDSEPAQKKRRTRRADRNREDEEDEEPEDEGEDYQPGNSEFADGSDWEVFGSRRRGGRGSRGARGVRGGRAQLGRRKRVRQVQRRGNRTEAGNQDDESDGVPVETPTKGPRQRGGRRGGLRSKAVADSGASNSESEEVVIRRWRSHKRPRVLNDSTDDVETLPEVMVAAQGVTVGGDKVDDEGEGEEEDEDSSAPVRGRSGRRTQVPARFRDNERASSS